MKTEKKFQKKYSCVATCPHAQRDSSLRQQVVDASSRHSWWVRSHAVQRIVSRHPGHISKSTFRTSENSRISRACQAHTLCRGSPAHRVWTYRTWQITDTDTQSIIRMGKQNLKTVTRKFEERLIIQQTAESLPVANHFTFGTCLNQFLQATVEQFRLWFYPVDIVYPHTLIERWHSLKVLPMPTAFSWKSWLSPA